MAEGQKGSKEASLVLFFLVLTRLPKLKDEFRKQAAASICHDVVPFLQTESAFLPF